MRPTDNPITVPTFDKASNGHVLNPVCPHNLFASQVDPTSLVTDPTQYIEKIPPSYERTFGSKPKKAKPDLEESDHGDY